MSTTEKVPSGRKMAQNRPNNHPKQQQGNNAQSSKQKQTKPAKKSNEVNLDIKREQKLQAIILVDDTVQFSFIENGSPLLASLVNTCVLDYTFEFLSQNGVEEIIVFSSNLHDIVDAFLKSSKWLSQLSVRNVMSSSCVSEGDALRELDAMNIVRSDPFILIQGGVVANINLKSAITFHKQKRADDPNNIMTVVLRKLKRPACSLVSLQDDLIVSMDRQTKQILLFENSLNDAHLRVSLDLMAQQEEMSFHTDLLDCRIDICSPEFLLQFSDNFDYQDIRQDFVSSEVCNWSLGKHIYGYVMERHEYAGRIGDARSFHGISQDIVSRWLYPLVPDSRVMNGDGVSHLQQINYSFKATDAAVSRSAVLGERVVVGSGTIVGERAVLVNTVVGENCRIAADVVVTGSHIHSNVTLEAGAHVSCAIVHSRATVGQSAMVRRGCVVHKDVTVAAGVVSVEFGDLVSDVTTSTSDKLECLGAQNLEDGADGPSGAIGCWEHEAWKRGLWKAFPPVDDDEAEDDYSEDGERDGFHEFDAHQHVQQQSGGDQSFTQVVSELVSTGHEEGHPAESLLMEIKGCKFAQNKSYADCVEGVVPALLQIALDHALRASGSGVFKSSEFLKKWAALLARDAWGSGLLRPILLDSGDRLALIQATEAFVLLDEHANLLEPLFRFLLQVAYDLDLVDEEGFLCWISQRQAGQSPQDLLAEKRLDLFLSPLVQQFVEWIQEDDEDDEDEEDEEDEEEDDEEDAA